MLENSTTLHIKWHPKCIVQKPTLRCINIIIIIFTILCFILFIIYTFDYFSYLILFSNFTAFDVNKTQVFSSFFKIDSPFINKYMIISYLLYSLSLSRCLKFTSKWFWPPACMVSIVLKLHLIHPTHPSYTWTQCWFTKWAIKDWNPTDLFILNNLQMPWPKSPT